MIFFYEFLFVAVAIEAADERASEGSSGWVTLHRPGSSREIAAAVALPVGRPMNLIIAVRSPATGKPKRAFVAFSEIAVTQALGSRFARRPRLGPP